MRKKNKKASIMDIFIAMILSFVLVLVCVVMVMAQHLTFDAIKSNAGKMQPAFPGANVSQIIDETVGANNIAFQSLDWISVMLIFGYFISILISAYLVRTHPAWWVAYIFIVIIAVIISAYLANAYEMIAENPLMTTYFLQFPGANFIFLNFPVWVAIIGILASILMHINLQRSQLNGT